MNYLPQKTIQYKTYLKRTMVSGLKAVFANHPDPLLAKTKVTLSYPRDEESYPAVEVKYYEGELHNMGIGHTETLKLQNPTTEEIVTFNMQHYGYTGTIEFVVYALSTIDRDLISDSLAQTLLMGATESYTNRLLAAVYPIGNPGIYPSDYANPVSQFHFINLNTDKLSGFGESETPVIWQSEDDLSYQTSYRIGVTGEFYSLPHYAQGYIDGITVYSYQEFLDDLPGGDPTSTALWHGEGDYTTTAEYEALRAQARIDDSTLPI